MISAKDLLTQKQLLIQKIKIFYIFILLTITLIRFSFYTLIANNGKLPIYYLDVIQYTGAVSEIGYIAVSLISILSLRIIYLINNGHNYEWFSDNSSFEWI